MTSRSLGHRAPLLWLVLPLMAGLAAGRVGDFVPVPWLLGGALIAAAAANFAAWRAPRWWAPAIAAAMFLAGSASYTLHRARIKTWEGLPLADGMAAHFAVFKDLPEATWAWWQKFSAAALRWFWPVLGIGLAAALVSAVSGPEFFHVWAPGGLIANLVLVPLAMLVIVAGFASVVAGLAGVTALGVLFNHAAMVLLVVIERLIRAGVSAPGAWWTANWRAPWMASAALTLLMAALLAGYAGGWRKERGGWWPPFAVAALGLILGVKFG